MIGGYRLVRPMGPGRQKCRAHSSTMYPALAHDSLDAHASSLVTWTARSPSPRAYAARCGAGAGGGTGGGIIVASIDCALDQVRCFVFSKQTD